MPFPRPDASRASASTPVTRKGILKGSRLDEVASLSIGNVVFVPGELSTQHGSDELPMVAQDTQAVAALKPERLRIAQSHAEEMAAWYPARRVHRSAATSYSSDQQKCAAVALQRQQQHSAADRGGATTGCDTDILGANAVAGRVFTRREHRSRHDRPVVHD